MKKSLIITYGLLLVFTLITAFLATSNAFSKMAAVLIMGISAIKFLLVAFQFMELKLANVFWKSTLIIVLSLILILVIGYSL